MKNFISTLLFGRDQFTGLIALGIIGLFVLGCTCGKNFDLGNIGKNDNTSRASNTSSDNPFGKDSDTDSDTTDGDMPDPTLIKALVKDTTASFAGAISTGDFSSIYNDASEDFKSTYTEDQMKDVFKEFIEKKRLILPILAKAIPMAPEFSPAPHLRSEKGLNILVVTGKYATSPVPLQFDYEYIKRDDEWKLLKLVVNLK
jgi:hypothetical protein